MSPSVVTENHRQFGRVIYKDRREPFVQKFGGTSVEDASMFCSSRHFGSRVFKAGNKPIIRVNVARLKFGFRFVNFHTASALLSYLLNLPNSGRQNWKGFGSREEISSDWKFKGLLGVKEAWLHTIALGNRALRHREFGTKNQEFVRYFKRTLLEANLPVKE
ncbi:hypothetical protein ACU8KH_02501 [Lachancea thermotolerans]